MSDARMDWPIRGNRSIPGCLSNELVIRPTAVTDGLPIRGALAGDSRVDFRWANPSDVACVSWSNGLESCIVQIGTDIGIHAMQKLVLLVCAAALLWPSHTCLLGGGLSQSEFQRLHELLQPDKQELWQTIPWKISLLDAQHAAAREHKPIFMWAMDGHPLGCT